MRGTWEERLEETRERVANMDDKPDIPVHLRDQADAAAKETLSMFKDVMVRAHTMHESAWNGEAEPTKEMRARLFAVLLGTEPCEHALNSGPAPLKVDMSAHKVMCSTCVAKHVPIDLNPGACDMCEEPTDLWIGSLMVMGLLAFAGNLCMDCHAAMEAETFSECMECHERIGWINGSTDGDGWWCHMKRPPDDHDAVPI